jgi:PEGA domain-containing protein
MTPRTGGHGPPLNFMREPNTMKKYTITFAALAFASCVSGCLDSGESKAKKAAAVATPAPTPARETEWRTIQADSQPQGAAILVNGENVGYAPVSINVKTFKDDGTFADVYLIRAVPTAPGEYQQYITTGPWVRNNNVIFYMYNNAVVN